MKTTAALALAALLATASAAALNPRQDYGPPPGHRPPPGRPGGPKKDKCDKKPLVKSEKLQKSITAERLLAGAQDLQDIAYAYPERNRLMGSRGHNDTVKYLVEQLEALDYYTVEKQKFSNLVQVNGTATLTIDGEVTESGIFEYSPSGNVTAELVAVANLGCTAADFPSTVAGKVALISRGECEFGLKSALAGAAGAAGAIIYNNIPGVFAGTLGVPPRPEGEYIPTLGISQEEGTALVAELSSGASITTSLDVVTIIELYTTENVIATSKCGNQNTTLVVGAHSDSVAEGPGINDDGSGTIGILEVAKELSKYKVNNAVRFGFWSGEESGLLGSTYYVEQLSEAAKANIRAYLNFDMIASPNFIHAIYDGDGSAFNLTGPSGSAEIEALITQLFEAQGQNTTETAFDGRSDYLAFIENGIPSGGTFTGAEALKTDEQAALFGGQVGVALDVNYHGAGDTVDNLNMEAFVLHARVIAGSVATYATSFESLPPKGVQKRNLAAQVARANVRRGGKWGRNMRV